MITHHNNKRHNIIKRNEFKYIILGSETISPCESTIWLIGYDTLKLSQSQLSDFPQSLLYEGRDVQKTKQEIFINFDIKKTEEKKIGQSHKEINSSQQPLNEHLSSEEMNDINKIKDSFILLGDPTIYDPFVFGHSHQPPTKFIKDTDYVIISKDNPKDIAQLKVANEIEDIVFKKLSDDQKEIDQLNNMHRNTTEVQGESTKIAETVNLSDEEQTESHNSSTPGSQEDEKQAFVQTQQEGTLKENASSQEKYAYNSRGEWDQVPIFSIEQWPELCKTGKRQSPINLATNDLMIKDEEEIIVYYEQLNKDPTLVNDGIKLSLVGKFGSIEFQGHLYEASLVHIHTPSEHTVPRSI